MVYFAPAHPVHPDGQPFSEAEWQQEGVTVVHRFGDLRASVGQETEVLIIDAEVLSQVDHAWLRAQARVPQPRVIVGVNLNLRELQEVLDAPQPWAAPWTPDDHHFAILATGQGCGAAGQDRFVLWKPLPTFMREWVQRYTECTPNS
jgi:hypothetical protein